MIKRLLLFFSILSVPVLSHAVISLDSTTVNNSNGITQVKYNMTNNAGNFIYCAIGGQPGSVVTISSVSYGASLLTEVVASTNVSGPTQCSLWYLINPNTGSNSVQVNYASSMSDSYVMCATLAGVNTASPIDQFTQNTSGGGTGSITASVTTTLANDWLVDCGMNNNANTITADPAQTVINVDSAGGKMSSYRGPLPVQTSSMTYTASSFSQPSYSLMAIDPSLAPPSPNRRGLFIHGRAASFL